MSRVMNHDKVKKQKRIEYESRPPRFPLPPAPKLKQKAPPLEWMMLDDEALPEKFFRDPNSLIQLHRNRTLVAPLLEKVAAREKMMLAHQLEALMHRAMHILPPQESREAFQFVITVDRDGVFEGVELVLKGNRPEGMSAGSKIVERLSELDITIPYRFRKPKLGMKRMAKCLRRIFFRDRDIKPCPWEFRRFFYSAWNFNLANCSSHTSVYWSEADHVKLVADYYREKQRN